MGFPARILMALFLNWMSNRAAEKGARLVNQEEKPYKVTRVLVVFI